jgi:UDP-2,3-diacylglucosamine pyrophosphatase LpxH
MKTYRSIFISDVHLGARSCKARQLDNFLKHNTCETLYLIGDIIDGWKVTKNTWRWDKAQTEVVKRILKISTTKTRVIYIPGNHDEFLRPMLHSNLVLHHMEFHNQYTHVGVDGKRYLLTHGDLFDGITRLSKWLSFLGDSAYDILLGLNTYVNFVRRKFGFGYWSLSKYLKYRVKKAIDFVFQFETNLADYCKKKGYDGVICGHIHHAEIKTINGVEYMNDGDWVESCTALVEHHDGRWEIITWVQTNDS